LRRLLASRANVSIETKRWTQLAQELRFQQLTAARKQAEGWRTGLTTLTTLLTGVLIIKGRDSVSGLSPSFLWTVVTLIAATLALLVIATLLTVRAASGAPSTLILLTGEELRSWTKTEVQSIGRYIRWATILTVNSICILALAIGITWTAPTTGSGKSLVEVTLTTGRYCGELLSISSGNLLLKNKTIELIPLTRVVAVDLVDSCS
jgi:hypothetical protein